MLPVPKMLFLCSVSGSKWELSWCCALPLGAFQLKAVCVKYVLNAHGQGLLSTGRKNSEGGFYSGFSVPDDGRGIPPDYFWLT